MANVSFNPALMTSAQNTFLLNTQGFIQGLTQDDWVSRAFLLPGVVASTVTQPMWGGMGLAVNGSASATDNRQGQSVLPATTTQINGFSVFDQGINMIQVPGNNVPTAQAGQSLPFYTFGTNARIPLPITGTVADFEGVPIGVQLYWDTVALGLTTVSSANTVALPSTVRLLEMNLANSKMVSYNSSTGAVTWLEGQPSALIAI
ncbi:MAG: hypothetical protein ACYCS8_17465 [Acidithiobacillus sp.]